MKGFWTETDEGRTIHVTGDPDMPEETRQALCRMADEAVKMIEKRKELRPEELMTLSGFLSNLLNGKRLEEVIDRYSTEGLEVVLAAAVKIGKAIQGDYIPAKPTYPVTFRRLVEVGSGKIQHINQGSCPDEFEGYESRDPDCPACKVLVEAVEMGVLE